MQDIIKKNLLQIQEEIAPSKPNIIAVTKYFDEQAIIDCYAVGLREFGESRVVDAIGKIEKLSDEIRQNSKFHFIGHLQTNKVKKVVAYFDLIHSVDSFKLAEVISNEAGQLDKVQNILLQYSNAGEIQKTGFSKQEIFEVFEQIQNLSNVNILGLMNMAPFGADEEELKKLFADVVEVKKSLEEKFNCNLYEVSMGISLDYKIAAMQGATILRVGRKLYK